MYMTSWEEVERRIEIDDRLKHDVRSTRHDLRVVDGKLLVREGNGGAFDFSDHAFGQLCAKADVPVAYAAKIRRRNVKLLDDVLNDGVRNASSEGGFLLRTRSYEQGEVTRGVARAVLSNDYTIYNNDDFVSLFLGMLSGPSLAGRHTLRSFSLDENGLWGKVLFNDLRAWDPSSTSQELKVGVIIGNSEIGLRNVTLRPFVYRKACTNDLVVVTSGDLEQRHIHIDRNELLRRATYALNKALEQGDQLLQRFIRSYEEKVEDPLKVIERLLKGGHYVKKVQDAARAAYLTEPFRSKFGVVNALTAAARNLDADERVRLESFAGEYLAAK